MHPKLISLDQVKASAEETENKEEDETIYYPQEIMKNTLPKKCVQLS